MKQYTDEKFIKFCRKLCYIFSTFLILILLNNLLDLKKNYDEKNHNNIRYKNYFSYIINKIPVKRSK